MENKNHINQIGKRKDEEIFSKTPENYFENLSSEIKNRISTRTAKSKFIFQKKSSLGWSLSSAFACVMLLMYFNFFYIPKTNDFNENMTYEEFLENELVNTININTDYEILNVSDENKTDTEIISDKIPVQELENYLIDEDDDIILYN